MSDQDPLEGSSTEKEAIGELLEQISRRNARIAQLREQEERHAAELEAERAKVAELSEALAEAEAVLARTKAKLDAKTASFDTVRAQLDSVRNSAGWRLIRRWRTTMAKVAPAGSFRRRLYRALTKPLRRARG